MGQPQFSDSTWADYAERTAGRKPLPFFETAIAVTGGNDGAGRLVLDLGCGAGVEVRAFLERGWDVFAVDAEPRAVEVLLEGMPEEHLSRLRTAVGRFSEVDLPRADLVYASLSLPFAGAEFDESVAAALEAVAPGGWFVAVFLGPNDTWASDDGVAIVDKSTLHRLLRGFEDITVAPSEFDGGSGAGPKHWHWYVVSAKKPA